MFELWECAERVSWKVIGRSLFRFRPLRDASASWRTVVPKLIDLRSCASGRWKSLDKQRRPRISRRFKIYVPPRGFRSAQWFFIGPFARRKKKRYTADEVSMVCRKCDRSPFTLDRKRIRPAYTAVILSETRQSIVDGFHQKYQKISLHNHVLHLFSIVYNICQEMYYYKRRVVLWIYGNKFGKFFSKFGR